VDLAFRLWQDRSIYRLRADKQSAALVAVFRTIEKHRPLNGGEAETIGLQSFIENLDDDVVSDLLGDPYARLWTRLAFALSGSVLRGEGVPPAARVLADEWNSRDVRALLALHLEQYKRLALGAALRAGVDLDLSTPFVVDLPFAIPACNMSLTGTGTATIRGVADGRLRFEGDGVRLEPCPLARIEDWTVPLQPALWLVPGLGEAPLAARTPQDFQERHRTLVEGGIGLIARHQPDVFAQMREVIRCIAVNPLSKTSPFNYISHSELPGAFAFQGIANPYSAAEASIHEFHHNRLFCLEECEPILVGDALGTEDHAGYYSPWREGLRPLRGILHGAYVSLAQLRFWIAVAQTPETGGLLAEFVTGQMIRQSLVVDLGLGQLERHAEFTPSGAALVAQMRRDLDMIVDQMCALGQPWDLPIVGFMPDGSFAPCRNADGAPMWMREMVARHVRSYDTLEQVPDEWFAANTPDGGAAQPLRAAVGGA
jgi:HEXXH motif-containing protein